MVIRDASFATNESPPAAGFAGSAAAAEDTREWLIRSRPSATTAASFASAAAAASASASAAAAASSGPGDSSRRGPGRGRVHLRQVSR